MNDQDYNKRFTTTEMDDQANPPSTSQNANIDPVGETMYQDQPDSGVAVDEEKEPITGDAVIPLDAPIDEDGRQAGFLNHEDSQRFRHSWDEIQSMFIDDPHAVVMKADALVSEVINHLSQKLGDECHALAGQWNEKNDVSTEDLRVTLQHYRALFNRIVD
ncbi:hypothetical protein FDZ73_22610 [bacterium]|nr:MAG: hypothetical protein FDZ73_22610 [bacterium]